MPYEECDALWLEEPLTEDVTELFNLAEIKRRVARELPDENLGLHALLEDPEAAAGTWWPERRGPRRRKKGNREARAA